ncbi:hypothetical protein CAP35_14565 [Chitinophagaceae bacterium IBVUCB1]|nr:hypothetical protein CAP35_14565 [Chitinophagaceae bacterium IBVUCB1]
MAKINLYIFDSDGMKKIARYILIVLGLLVLYLSTSKTMMQKISDARNDHDEWWGSHFPYEGDLVGMSYLYYEKRFHKPKERVYEPKQCDSNNNINLVLWGDSYTQYMGDTCFCAATYQYGRRFFSNLTYRIDSTKRNILVIECTERLVRGYFSDTRMLNEVVKSDEQKSTYIAPIPHTTYVSFAMPNMASIFNEHINQNLEYNLFNYNFINPVRKMKAWMNYKIFNRASGDAVLAAAGDRLYLKSTLSSTSPEGYTTPLTNKEVNQLVQTLNTIHRHYKAAGFDEVYLSLIPNAVTIYQPQGYNGLIPCIQSHPDLQMKCIDIYTVFLQNPDGMYWRGDTHWSNEGASRWLQIVNAAITHP